jgi:hypothetical protein
MENRIEEMCVRVTKLLVNISLGNEVKSRFSSLPQANPVNQAALSQQLQKQQN